MANISILFKDGTKREFPDIGRPGGSWTNEVKYEGAFVVVTDEYGKTYAFPKDDVKEVNTSPSRHYW